MQIDYQLTPRHLAAYQYAVRDRMRAITGAGTVRERLSYAALALSTCLLLIGGDVALAQITDAPTSAWALAFGLVLGAAITIGTYWVHYFSQRSRIVQPDGPTLRLHTMDAGDTRLIVQTEGIDASYAWRHFEAVTEHADILVLWIEPALGLVMSRDAFKSPEVERDFFEPRAGADRGGRAIGLYRCVVEQAVNRVGTQSLIMQRL